MPPPTPTSALAAARPTLSDKTKSWIVVGLVPALLLVYIVLVITGVLIVDVTFTSVSASFLAAVLIVGALGIRLWRNKQARAATPPGKVRGIPLIAIAPGLAFMLALIEDSTNPISPWFSVAKAVVYGLAIGLTVFGLVTSFPRQLFLPLRWRECLTPMGAEFVLYLTAAGLLIAALAANRQLEGAIDHQETPMWDFWGGFGTAVASFAPGLLIVGGFTYALSHIAFFIGGKIVELKARHGSTP